jgi:hypothetical protein
MRSGERGLALCARGWNGRLTIESSQLIPRASLGKMRELSGDGLGMVSMRALLFLWRHDVASSENRPLSKRQQLFVTHFIEGASGVKAAEAAGYRGDDRALRSTASRLLTYRNIKKAIRQAYADAGVDPAAILGKLAALAFGDSTAQVQLRALEIMARHTLVTKVETAQGVITLDRRTVGRGEGGKLVLLEGGAGATSGAEAGTPGGRAGTPKPVAEGGGSEA